MLRDSALEASHSAQRRINMVEGDSEMAQRLAGEKARQATAHNVLSRLLSACNQYLFQLRLPIGYYLEPVVTKASPNKGETPQQAIERVRVGIGMIGAQLAAARRAPLSRQSQQDAIHAYLARLAMAGRPKVQFDAQGSARIAWPEDIATMNSVVGLLALICPAELVSAFQLDTGPEPPNALSVAERDAAIAKLSDDLLALERVEAALLSLADGILPRSEISPLAYLQLQIVAQQEEAQAAVA
jgi:hypothetical protein